MPTTKRLILTGFAGSLALAALSLSSVARADQFVVIDETWTHTPDLADSHKRFSPSTTTPANWVSPVDYSSGTAYVYMEVHTKPTAQPTKFQVCFEATPTYACTDQSPTYTTIGTYNWSTPFANFYQPDGTQVDWTKGVNMIACILKDTMNNKPSADNVGATEAALYTPTDVRMVVTIVTPGGTYVPPPPMGEGGAGGTGSTASSTNAGPTVGSSAATSGASTAAGATSATGSGTGSGGASSNGDSNGCSVSGDSRGDSGDGPNALPCLFIAALWAQRRRRAR